MRFILATQDDETGGFADRPGDMVSQLYTQCPVQIPQKLAQDLFTHREKPFVEKKFNHICKTTAFLVGVWSQLLEKVKCLLCCKTYKLICFSIFYTFLHLKI